MGQMMNDGIQCGALMMAGMGIFALLAILTLGTVTVAAIRYLRSGPPSARVRAAEHGDSAGGR